MSKPEKYQALPELDPGALVVADLAWVETPGSPAERTKVAIRTYLWATQIADQQGTCPSLNQWRAASNSPE